MARRSTFRTLCAWFVLLSFSLQLCPGLLLAQEMGAMTSTGSTATTTSEGQNDDKAQTVNRMKTLLGSIAVTVASSPFLMRMITGQLAKIGDQSTRKWVRQSFFVADQVIAEAQRAGIGNGQKLSKASLVHKEMGKVLQQAGWLERVALRKKIKSGEIYQDANKIAGSLSGKTYYGEVAELHAGGRIGVELADDLLRVQREAELTPRQLAAELLRKTDLSPQEIRELGRVYETKQRIRVTGTRESMFDASVLDMVEPWRDGGGRAKRASYVSRDVGADLLIFRSDPESFTRYLMQNGKLSGSDAQRVVDNYTAEIKKEQAWDRQHRQATSDDGTGKTAAGDGANTRPKAISTDDTIPQPKTMADDGATPGPKTVASDGTVKRPKALASDGTTPRAYGTDSSIPTKAAPPSVNDAPRTATKASQTRPNLSQPVGGADQTGHFKPERTYKGKAVAQAPQASSRQLQGIVAKVKAHSGTHSAFLDRFRTPVRVVETNGVFVRNQGQAIEISSTLMNRVLQTSGEKGVAFLLAHELAENNLRRSGGDIKPAALEFEADRLGYDWARKAYPDLDGTAVKKVFQSFEVSDGRAMNRLGDFSKDLGAHPSHPVDSERMYRLAQSNDFATNKGFSQSQFYRGAFQADESLGQRLQGLRRSYRTGGTGKAAASIRYDFLQGGLLVDVAVSAGMRLISRWQAGEGFKDGFQAVGKEMASSEFIIGDLLGGTIGAAVGSMITIPGVASLGGFLGTAVGILPAVLCTMAFAQVGYTSISLAKRGEFSFQNLMKAINLPLMLGQVLGASLGMAVGTILMPGAIGAILGGILGGTLSVTLLSKIFKTEEAPKASVTTEGASPTVSDPNSQQNRNPAFVATGDATSLSENVRDCYQAYLAAHEKRPI